MVGMKMRVPGEGGILRSIRLIRGVGVGGRAGKVRMVGSKVEERGGGFSDTAHQGSKSQKCKRPILHPQTLPISP